MTPNPDLDNGAPSHDTAGGEIGDLVAAAVRHQSDPDPFLVLHTDDVVLVNIAGRRVLGRDDLEAAMRGALASPLGLGSGPGSGWWRRTELQADDAYERPTWPEKLGTQGKMMHFEVLVEDVPSSRPFVGGLPRRRC
jgi:hypothetical protein